MKFPGFDFNAIKNFVDNMSDEEKEQITNMAADMMQNMPNQNQPVQEEEEETEDVFAYYGIDESLADRLGGEVLSALEAASDLEQYYEDDPEADLSASVLFLSKAVLQLLRKNAAPVFDEAGKPGFSNPNATTLFQYVQSLDEDLIQKLCDQAELSQEGVLQLKNDLMQLYILLQRAEYDRITAEELQACRQLLLADGLLEKLAR